MSAPLVAVLAAGAARRFGGGKLDAHCAGKPLGQWALDAVAQAGLAPGVLVVPEGDVPAFAAASGWPLITNPRADDGLATSVALAAGHALSEKRDLLVVLADMPLVTPAHLTALVDAGGLAASDHGEGRAGVPALFPLAVLPEVATLAGEAGAGRWLAARSDCRIIAAVPGSLADIDRPEDLARIAALLSRRG